MSAQETQPDTRAEGVRQLHRRAFVARSAAATAALAAGAALPLSTPSPARAAGSRGVRVPGVKVRPAARQDPTEATIAEAVTLIRRGQLNSVDLTEALLERIARFEPTYLAFNAVLHDAALAAAKKQDRHRRGALGGIPLCIKDNYFTRGVPTTANSFIFADFVPGYNATSVGRLLRAGGILLGKGQMGPLATTRATQPNGTITTVNAWTPTDSTVDPGGSSTGPACAVAGRMATSSIGTQTGGSIVLPSNQQNLTGLKPTMGRTSIHGVIPLSYTRDHSGPLARDAMDAAIMMQIMAGPDRQDVRTLGLPDVPDLIAAATPVQNARGKAMVPRRTKVGVPPDYLDPATVPADVLALRTAFLDTLRSIKNVAVVAVTYPPDWTLLTGTAFNNIRLPERTEEMLPFLQQDPKLFGVSGLTWLQGLFFSGDEWITGQRAKHRLLREVLAGPLETCDLLLQTSPNPFDSIGLPEIGIPIGFHAVGANPKVPVGTIIGAGPYEEDRLLELAAAYQQVTDWHEQRPADPPAPAAARRSGTLRERVAVAAKATAAQRGDVRHLTPEQAARTSA